MDKLVKFFTYLVVVVKRIPACIFANIGMILRSSLNQQLYILANSIEFVAGFFQNSLRRVHICAKNPDSL